MKIEEIYAVKPHPLNREFTYIVYDSKEQDETRNFKIAETNKPVFLEQYMERSKNLYDFQDTYFNYTLRLNKNDIMKFQTCEEIMKIINEAIAKGFEIYATGKIKK